MFGDFVDRLNYRYTPILCGLFAICLSWRLQSPESIQCWTPAVFTSAMQQYAEATCRNQYRTHVPEDGLHAPAEPSAKYTLHSWLPILIVLHAVLALAPLGVWRIFTDLHKGLDAENLVKMCQQAVASNGPADGKEKNFDKIGRVIYGLSKENSSSLAMTYILVKLLAQVGSLFQMAAMSSYLHFNNTRFGYEIVKNMTHGLEWQHSPSLPPVILCNYSVKVLGNVHRYSLQCVLPGNLEVEKLFVFLWFWFALLIVLNLFSALKWISGTLLSVGRRRILNKHLIKPAPKSFANRNLGADGAFCFRMIGIVAGPLAESHVIDAMLNAHCDDQQRNRDDARSPPPFRVPYRYAPADSYHPNLHAPADTNYPNNQWNAMDHRPVPNFPRQNIPEIEPMEYNIGEQKRTNQTYNSSRPDTYPMNTFDVDETIAPDPINVKIYPSAPVQDDLTFD